MIGSQPVIDDAGPAAFATAGQGPAQLATATRAGHDGSDFWPQHQHGLKVNEVRLGQEAARRGGKDGGLNEPHARIMRQWRMAGKREVCGIPA